MLQARDLPPVDSIKKSTQTEVSASVTAHLVKVTLPLQLSAKWQNFLLPLKEEQQAESFLHERLFGDARASLLRIRQQALVDCDVGLHR